MCFFLMCTGNDTGMAVLAWLTFLVLLSIFMGGPAISYFGMTKELWIVPIGFALMAVYVTALFAAATCMDPGVYPRATTPERASYGRVPRAVISVPVLGQDIQLKYCVTCHFYRPPRCSHCSRCDTCVCVFDHHCPWLNNCGKVNSVTHEI